MSVCCSTSPGGGGGAGQDVGGATPTPGGWNRIQVVVDSLDETLERLRSSGVPVRGDVVTGDGGQVLKDVSGDPMESFEPAPR